MKIPKRLASAAQAVLKRAVAPRVANAAGKIGKQIGSQLGTFGGKFGGKIGHRPLAHREPRDTFDPGNRPVKCSYKGNNIRTDTKTG